MASLIHDPNNVTDDIKALGDDAFEAWTELSPFLAEFPYPASEGEPRLRIKILGPGTYQLMLFPHQKWVSYYVTDDQDIRLLSVVEIPED